MDTKILKIDSNNINKAIVKDAAEVLKNGGTVIFPTETVYGLGANALDENAVKKIFKAKGRPSDNPLIVHVSSIDEIESFVDNIPDNAKIIAEHFWPGPITIILKKSPIVPLITTGGLDTVAIRIPNHKIALELIKSSGVPIAAPSANISGKPSPTSFKHVFNDLNGKVDVIIDGGNSSVGVESTVLDLSRDIPTIVRPGGITSEQLSKVLDRVEIDKTIIKSDENIIPISPGMKYTHYSPDADAIIVEGELSNMVDKINILCQEYAQNGKKVGIMATDQTKKCYQYGQVISLGDRNNIEEIAANLFSVLREFDNIGVDIILAESFEKDGIGLAVMNRLVKAAGHNIIKS